jgi:hypothetical protein
MRHETLFLKIVIFLMGLPILALCILWLPGFAKDMLVLYPTLSPAIYALLTIMYVSALPYYFALFQTVRLLSCIDSNEAFSDLSIIALKKIKFSAFTICILYGFALPLIYLVADASDAPGMIIMGLGINFASFVIAIFATVLEKLLKNAMEIKSENDLTV